MKKLFSILAVSAVISLAACSSNTTTTEGTDSTAAPSTTEAVDSVAKTTPDSTHVMPADSTHK